MKEQQQKRPTVAAMMAGAVSGIPAYLRPAVAVPLGNLARDLDELIGDLERRIKYLEEMASIQSQALQIVGTKVMNDGGEHAKTDK